MSERQSMQTSDGFRATVTDPREQQVGLCRLFPRTRSRPELNLLWDRMWGLEIGDAAGDRALHKAASQVCSVCPLQYECLAEAMDGSYVEGIFGGLTRMERKALARMIRDTTEFRTPPGLRRRQLLRDLFKAEPQLLERAAKAAIRKHKRDTGEAKRKAEGSIS